MSNEIIKYSRNLVQTISDTLALSDKLRSISEAEAYYKLCMEHVEKEEYKLAKKYVLKALELHPKFYTAHLELIALCANMGEYDGALQYAELALKQFPENAVFFYTRGSIYAGLFEKHEEAISDYSRAIELEQRLPVQTALLHELFSERAKSKEQVGDIEGSISDKLMYLEMRDLYERKGGTQI